jgi:hypothetical protein
VLLPISTALFAGRGTTGSVVTVYGAHLALISLLNLLLWLEVRRSAGVGERIAGSFLTFVSFVTAVAVGAVRSELAQFFWYAAFAMPGSAAV